MSAKRFAWPAEIEETKPRQFFRAFFEQNVNDQTRYKCSFCPIEKEGLVLVSGGSKGHTAFKGHVLSHHYDRFEEVSAKLESMKNNSNKSENDMIERKPRLSFKHHTATVTSVSLTSNNDTLNNVPLNMDVFNSQEEFETINHFHDAKYSEEILSATISDLVSVVAYRRDANRHFQLCARQLNSFMRANYTDFIHNCGLNIYPLIIASDFEPGFEGVGSSFTLYREDGSSLKIAPTVHTDYEAYKALSHTALAIFILLSPHFHNPSNIQWVGKLTELKKNLEVFADALQLASKEPKVKAQLNTLVEIYLSFIDECLTAKTFSLEGFQAFTAKSFELIRLNMADATAIQARCILIAMLKWKKLLGPEEWSKLYVVIPTVWPVALNSPRLQLFKRIIDPDKLNTHIITSEYPRNFVEARNTLGRVVGDRAVGRLVFGTADTKAKMKVIALSSPTDVVADDFEIALDHVCASLSADEQALICQLHSGHEAYNSHFVKNSSMSPPPGCPMHNAGTGASLSSGNSDHTVKKRKTTDVHSSQQIRLVKNVMLLGEECPVDIHINCDGSIEKIEPNDLTMHTPAVFSFNPSNDVIDGVLDAVYRTAVPGLVDPHVHLDKAYLLDRCCAKKGDFPEAMKETLDAKSKFTAEDVFMRARRLIEKEISFGTTLMRAHVEVDPIVGLTSYDAIKSLKHQYEGLITIQLCLFAQEGITNQPGQIGLFEKVLAEGETDVVGSAPYCDPNPKQNIDIIFNLAKKYNKFVDFHLDYFLEGKESHVSYVIEKTIAHEMHGRVSLGHMTHLSTLQPDALFDIAKGLQEAGITVISLPASDICMMARDDTQNKRRGVCPVHSLAKVGAAGTYATNNVQNLFTFTGDGDVLKIGTLLCQLLHLTSESDAALCLEMGTSVSAKALGYLSHGLIIGSPADFFLVDYDRTDTTRTGSIRPLTCLELFATPPMGRTVFKRGKLVSQSTHSFTLFH